jgi:transposase
MLTETIKQKNLKNKTCGIDLGLKEFATITDDTANI